MSIRQRLASFIFVMISFLALVGGMLLLGGPLILTAFRQSIDSMDSLDAIRELRSNVARERISLNQYLLLDDSHELMNFEDSSRSATKSLDSMKTHVGKNIPNWYPELSDLYKKTADSADNVVSHYKKGNKQKAYEEDNNIFDSLIKFVSDLEQEKSAEAQMMFERSKQLTKQVESAVLLVLLIAFILSMVLFRSLYRAVMNPLEALRLGAVEFGKGHWDHRIDLSSKNEFGSLAESFNTMAENVKQLQMQAVHMDRMSAVGQLAGGVAHEINNPLTAVLGQAQILMARLGRKRRRVSVDRQNRTGGAAVQKNRPRAFGFFAAQSNRF